MQLFKYNISKICIFTDNYSKRNSDQRKHVQLKDHKNKS